MERRNKTRHDLQLVCHIGSGKVLSRPVAAAVTSNVSRDGMLMSWQSAVPLPEVGSHLTVDVELPGQGGLDVRFMRCRTTVVRIDVPKSGEPSVALHIEQIRFVDNSTTIPAARLKAMPVVSGKLN